MTFTKKSHKSNPPLNVEAVVAEKVVDSWKQKNRRLFNEIEPNASMNVVAAVAEKDDSFEEKNRRLRLKLNFWLVLFLK